MASYYADLCVNYYEGRMYQIEEAAKENPVLEDWNKIGYVSELSDFLQNILEDGGEGLRASEDSERTLNKNGGTRRHGRDKKTAFAADKRSATLKKTIHI